MKVLVVDDSAVMRKMIINVLQQAGVTDVEQASNGAEAVEAVANGGEFGLILLDWNMPVKSGIEALKEIRAGGCKTPVMMVTTESEKARVVEAIKNGANNYLVKPFTPAMISQKIKETCGL